MGLTQVSSVREIDSTPAITILNRAPLSGSLAMQVDTIFAMGGNTEEALEKLYQLKVGMSIEQENANKAGVWKELVATVVPSRRAPRESREVALRQILRFMNTQINIYSCLLSSEQTANKNLKNPEQAWKHAILLHSIANTWFPEITSPSANHAREQLWNFVDTHKEGLSTPYILNRVFTSLNKSDQDRLSTFLTLH
jgi:hypothetical protein